MTVLVTGGAGFIGSHTSLKLLENGFDIIILDNLSNSSEIVIDRLEKLSKKKIKFIQEDIQNKQALKSMFEEYNITSVIHFAALKAVGESNKKPLEYYQNNITGTLNLLDAMKKANVKNIIFSSSATVYGNPKSVPIKEDDPIGETTNPYGTSKVMVEKILQDLSKSDEAFSIINLRYFNPIGAHQSGEIGEDPTGIPSNLMPFITQIASGRLEKLSVFGNDFNTPDGTGVRDYIHVDDLAQGHVDALKKIESGFKGCSIYNLGTGCGYSVLEMIEAFEQVNQIKIPYKIVKRRDGDIDACYADCSLAQKELGWKAIKTLEDMVGDSWNWQKNNPNGYSE